MTSGEEKSELHTEQKRIKKYSYKNTSPFFECFENRIDAVDHRSASRKQSSWTPLLLFQLKKKLNTVHP